MATLSRTPGINPDEYGGWLYRTTVDFSPTPNLCLEAFTQPGLGYYQPKCWKTYQTPVVIAIICILLVVLIISKRRKKT